MTEAPISYDASGVRIGGGLNQDDHYVTYFSERLNDAK